MSRSSKKKFMEKCKMIKNNKDIVNNINKYMRINKSLISLEYSKVVNKSMDKETSNYGFMIANIYKEYFNYESYILTTISRINNSDDVKNKIRLFQDIFRSFHKIEELIERFKEVKENFYMSMQIIYYP